MLTGYKNGVGGKCNIVSAILDKEGKKKRGKEKD